MEFAVFSPNFRLETHACGCVSAKIFPTQRRQTSSDRSKRGDDRIILEAMFTYDIALFRLPVRRWMVTALCRPVLTYDIALFLLPVGRSRLWMVTALRRPENQKKKYFCFSNRLFLQSRSPRVGRVGRCVFTTTVFGTCVFCVE